MRRAVAASALLLGLFVRGVEAEVLVRWDQDMVPARPALGIDTLLIPIDRTEAIREAVGRGYRVFVEVDATKAATIPIPAQASGGVVVRGSMTEAALRRLRARIGGRAVLTVDERGTWPHVRLNAVTARNDVLQVASPSAQPWLENNLALSRIANLHARPTTLLAYPSMPLDGLDEVLGPGVEHYLVALAEAGSAGASLVLPLHRAFQQALLKGLPDARRDWEAIRRAMTFHAWGATRRFVPMADVAVVTAAPLVSFEMLNLLARHNVPFTLVAPDVATPPPLPPLVIVADTPGPSLARAIADLEAGGGVVVRPDGPVVEPDAFALEVRNRLGPSRRTVDIWNGITVLVTPWRDELDGTMRLAVVNYAHQPRPVQLRVRGAFTRVLVETPEQEALLVPFTHRDGQTEFVLPAVQIAARVFLMTEADAPGLGSGRP